MIRDRKPSFTASGDKSAIIPIIKDSTERKYLIYRRHLRYLCKKYHLNRLMD